MNEAVRIALLGNQNCGKTTLFNALTGACQQIGNWAGVTVEKHERSISLEGQTIIMADLPGIYTLNQNLKQCGLDESLTQNQLRKDNFDLIINVLDSQNLERQLYLTMQLLEMGFEVIVVLNKIDILNKQGACVDTQALAKSLGCPVISLSANKGKGLNALKKAIIEGCTQKTTGFVRYPQIIENAIEQLLDSDVIGCKTRFEAICRLEDTLLPGDLVLNLQTTIENSTGFSVDVAIATYRYQTIERLCKQVISKPVTRLPGFTQKLDNLMLSRFWGIPAFFMVMYLTFMFAIQIGGVFQDFFEQSSYLLFVEGFSRILSSIQVPEWGRVVLSTGIGQGLSTTITFIPVLGCMFLALSFLEESGYMARAAFVMDRLMNKLGLPGKAIAPLIVGFGCNVPAILGARTIENKKEQILTILLSPFMSCGARLAIFTVFVAAFFKEDGSNIIFLLYSIGILMAILTGLALRSSLLKTSRSPLIMEMPQYQLPPLKLLFSKSYHRLAKFVTNAAKVIVPFCVLLSALNLTSTDGELLMPGDPHTSILEASAKSITPIFAPMGISNDNWEATVGLITGVVAKEVVVGTLNTLYSQEMVEPEKEEAISEQLWAAFTGIAVKFKELTWVPIKANEEEVSDKVYGIMANQFDGKIGAFAYLLFILLYVPCISVYASMVKEANTRWAIFSVVWTTSLAYICAVGFYQVATFMRHPVSSFSYLFAMLVFSLSMLYIIKLYSRRYERLIPTPITISG